MDETHQPGEAPAYSDQSPADREGAGTDSADEERTAGRAGQLLPEEEAAGSQDPQGQAEAILADSDLRSGDRSATAGELDEHRTSDEATEPLA